MTNPGDQYPGQQGSYPPPGSFPTPSNQPPAYGAPGYPPAGYGQPYGPVRPGMVTAAAVLAFVSGGLSIIFSLVAFTGMSLLAAVGISTGLYSVLLILSLILAAGLIWGGVQALSGKDTRILTIVGGASILISLITWITVEFTPGSLLSLVIPILIISFCLNPASKAWVSAKGGQSF